MKKFLVWVALVLAGAAFGSPALAAPGAFIVSKEKLTAGNCHGPVIAGSTNPNHCTFRIRIRNVSVAPYSGAMTIGDTVYMAGSPVQVPVLSATGGWSCTAPTAPGAVEITCSHPSVTIAAGQFTDFELQLDLATPAPTQSNCARVILPPVNMLTTGCTMVSGPSGMVDISKTFAPHSPAPPSGSTFVASMTCDLPTPHVAYISLNSAGGLSTPEIAGSNCTITELDPTVPLPAGCSWQAPAYPLGNSRTIAASPAITPPVQIENRIFCAVIGNPVLPPVVATPARPREKPRGKQPE